MNYHVLIVEDDQNYRFALRSMYDWEENGFEITAEAIHGVQALEFLKQYAIDLVITDMSMPMMNGLDLIRRMKEDYPAIPVIVLSAYDDFPFVKESLKLGALDYILKQEMTEEGIAKTIAEAKSHLSKDNPASEEHWDFIHNLLARKTAPEKFSPISAELCMNLEEVTNYIHSQTRKICQTLPSPSVIDQLYLHIYFDIIRRYTIAEHQKEQLTVLSDALRQHRLVLEKENCLLKHLKRFWQEYIILVSCKTKEISRVIEYIHAHYAENLSLTLLADSIGLSPNYLSNLFKAETGETLTQYINKVRIEKAKYLMKNTSLRVYEIAHTVGFNNPTYFSNMFKKITNLSVMEYRKSLTD